jgi:ElaB/YqjD/DUF883 family membrane-anchored ribosome-binding protein
MANPSNSSRTTEAVRSGAGQVAEKAKEAASTVSGMVGQTVSKVGEKADDVASSAGAGIEHLGKTLQQQGPREGMLGSAAQTAAGALKQGGHYLEEQGLSGIMDDMTNLIKRNPVPALLIGLGIGILIGRALRS